MDKKNENKRYPDMIPFPFFLFTRKLRSQRTHFCKKTAPPHPPRGVVWNSGILGGGIHLSLLPHRRFTGLENQASCIGASGHQASDILLARNHESPSLLLLFSKTPEVFGAEGLGGWTWMEMLVGECVAGWLGFAEEGRGRRKCGRGRKGDRGR